MKYILLEHAEGNDPKQLRIFETVDARARATREAILGTPDDDNKDMPCPELLELATDGRVDFEGDPSIEWIDAEVPDQNFITPNASLPPLDPESPKRKMLIEVEDSAIPDYTFNPWVNNWGNGAPRRRTKTWGEPVKWNRDVAALQDDQSDVEWPFVHRPRVLCVSDWLDEEVPIEWLADFLKLIHDTPNLDWQLFVERPENLAPRLNSVVQYGLRTGAGIGMTMEWLAGDAPANVRIERRGEVSDKQKDQAYGSATVVELSGNETEEQCKDIAWQMFCNAHPVETYQHNPEGFWKHFHARAPDMTREQMVALLKECEE